MNILIDKLPHHVIIDRVKYSINHDFRTSIKFELLIQESELPKKDKIIKILNLYYDDIPKNVNKAIDKILWFYSCGQDIEEKSTNNEESQFLGVNQRAYSFNYDKNYIFSAFYQIYGIDLSKTDMHWWKFKALFKGLTDDCLFSKIMYYRTVEINSKMSKDYQQRLRKLKELYALPLTKSEQKYLDELEKALIDGDLSGIEF